ncbi:hypothetical protein LEMLEM_LOCUS12332, partial [Lemmus lemmus]
TGSWALGTALSYSAVWSPRGNGKQRVLRLSNIPAICSSGKPCEMLPRGGGDGMNNAKELPGVEVLADMKCSYPYHDCHHHLHHHHHHHHH